MFGGGDFASDMAINGWRNASIQANNRADSWEKEAIRLGKNLDQANRNVAEMNEAFAATVGVRCAFEEQLRFVDPKNPLLNDQSLIQRIKDAAVAGMIAAGEKISGASEVGRTFSIPSREKGPPEFAMLRAEKAGLLALRAALVRQLLIHDPTNPLLGDPMLQMKVQMAGQTAFIMNKESLDTAREAGKTFVIPGRE